MPFNNSEKHVDVVSLFVNVIHLKSFLDVCRRKMSANFIILSAHEMLFTA